MGKTQQLAQGTVNRFKIQSDTQAELSKGEQGLKLRVFFPGSPIASHKLHKGFAYIKQYIFGLPAEI